MKLSTILEATAAAVQAKALGLTHAGFDKYKNPAGKITHKSDGKKLIPIKSKGKDDEGKKPQATFMMGAPGAGKTTWVNKNIGKDIKNINPDDVNTEHFTGTVGSLRKAFDKSIDFVKEEVEAGRSFVFDATGGNHALLKELMQSLKKNGYKTKLVYIDVPLETALERAKARADSGGRFVHPKGVEKTYAKVQDSYKEVKDLDWDNVKIVN